MYKSFSMELAGRTLTVDIGRVCKWSSFIKIWRDDRAFYRDGIGQAA